MPASSIIFTPASGPFIAVLPRRLCQRHRHEAMNFSARALCPSEPDGYSRAKEADMNEDVFNTSIRKFLKTLGVSAQREIEKAVREALADGRLKGNESFPAKATVTIQGIGLSHEIKGEIELG
jgi:Family of unknown function (DUF6494)